MGRKCGVKDCHSDSTRAEDLGVTFHKIPLHANIRPKWLQLCQIAEDRKLIYVCSRHFLRADFCNFKGKKYMLRQGVLPSIFAWNRNATKVKKEAVTDNVKPPKEKEVEIKQEPSDVASNDTKSAQPKEPNDVKSVIEKIKVENKEEKVKNSTTIEQKIKTVNTSTGELTFVPNTRIEALDFNQTWTPATILEVDYEENEVLVHFDNHTSKHDEWIGINSSSIRAITNNELSESKNIEVKTEPDGKGKPTTEYEEGERCMASWTDSRKFPATVSRVVDSKTYEVLFDDGYVKTLKSHRMSKSTATSQHSLPLFQPVEGTKEERRTRKRKINVSSLFGKKRPKVESNETAASPIEVEKPKPVEKEKVKDEKSRWYPSWENDFPVGIKSDALINDGYTQSYIVPDPNLPQLWEKHIAHEKTTELWISVIKAPDGTKFTNKKEIRKYLKDNPELYLSESLFDFSISNKSDDDSMKKENSLKILQVEDGYQCPIEGCDKMFRRENLAQMHVKHYHPKYTKFLESTPNVADLAYARTVGENLDKSPNAERFTTPKSTKQAKAKTSDDEVASSIQSETTPRKDAEIIKLLNSTPFDLIKSTDSSNSEPLPSGLPPSMYPDIKLKDLLVKSESIPKENEAYLKSLSTATVRPAGGLKTLLPVRREKEDDSRRGIKRRPKLSENLEKEVVTIESPSLLTPEQQSTDQNNIIIEGGEVIKIVRMKQEEIINCTCGITEEDGLMIQCELCLCWQHAYCNNIQKENEVPEKYVCYICQHPARQRNSKKYMHDQDWLKHGMLPSASYHCKDEDAQKKRAEKLKASHDLSGGLLELKDFMHTIKLKIKIAEAKNHPKLYLWSKPWEKPPLPEKQDIKKDENSKPQVDSMLLNLLKTGNGDETKIKEELTLENEISNATCNIPQPEAPIKTADCRVNLLDHIQHCQKLVEERLNDFEKHINELDASLVNDNDDSYVRIRHTTSMLLRDVNTMKELSQISTF